MQRATGLHDVGRQVVHVHVAQSLLDYRICNGSFTRDPVEYRRDLVGTMAAGKTTSTEVKSADGRSISVINRPMAGGSWAATHEDITERRDAERERVSMQEQQQRRTIIEQAIFVFRQRVEDHLKTVAEGAARVLRWWPPKSNHSRCKPPRQPKIFPS
jgi:hypothetical protein